MNIQEKLKELRMYAKLTQEQVGRAIFNEGAELTKAAISQYELEKNIPLDTLEKWLKVFGYELEIVKSRETLNNTIVNSKKSIEEILLLSNEKRVDYLFVHGDNDLLAVICNIPCVVIGSLSLNGLKDLLTASSSSINDNDLQYILENKKRPFENKFSIITISHDTLVEEFEKAVKIQTGVDMQFDFELASDENLDLYRRDCTFNLEVVENLVNANRLSKDILEEYRELYVENNGDTDTDPFDLVDELSLSNVFFSYMIEKTYGENAYAISADDMYDFVLIKIAIPAN